MNEQRKKERKKERIGDKIKRIKKDCTMNILLECNVPLTRKSEEVAIANWKEMCYNKLWAM